jgi:CRISPR/Cas system-associated protein Cas10 (large subunit of type III CRISPR-Cas system)
MARNLGGVEKWEESQIRNIFELIDFDNDNKISSNEWDYVFSRFELKKELEKSLLNNSESKKLEERKRILLETFENSAEKRNVDHLLTNI